MDQIKILKRAFRISWEYRALWLVGLLLVLVGGGVAGLSGGPPGNPSGSPEVSGGGEEWRDVPNQWPQVWSVIGPILLAAGIVILLIVAFAVVIGLARVVVRYITWTSLIRMVNQYEETGEELSVGSGLKLGWSGASFQLFLVSLILKLPIALLMVVLIVPAIALAVISFIDGSGASIVLGVILILALIPIGMLGAVLGIVVGPWIQIAYRACAIEGLGAWQGVRCAFGLIRRHLGATALQWLLLVGMGIAWRIALIPANLLLVVLAFLVGGIPGGMAGGIGALIGGWPWGVGLGLLLFLPLFILVVALPNLALNSAATVYHSTVWTLTYRELKAIDVGEEDIAA